ncbi:MAG: peptidase M16, partial [Gemmatimonadetes bacterium]
MRARGRHCWLVVGLGGLGLCAALVPLPVAAQQAGQIRYETFALPNGLRVIYSEDHSTPIVSVDVWYNTGSRNERPGRSGFAHLFEHMMFQGSAHVKKTEHFQYVNRAGGVMNGSTTEDRTNFWETLPSNRLNLALWLEADRMRSLAVNDENFHN